MAARRKRRKGAGPPPAVSPRRAAMEAAPAKTKAKRPPGEPVPASPRGVFLRAGLVAGVFYPYLVLFADEDPLPALIIALFAFALMVPLGLFLDRVRYSRQKRRYEQKRAGSAKQ
jgi:hypothetical protein